MNEYIILCEDSLEGIMSGVYYAWKCKREHETIKLAVKGNYELQLFAVYEEIDTNKTEALKVLNTIYNKLGKEAYQWICMSCESESADKANAVYKMIHFALSLQYPAKICEYLSNEYVGSVFAKYRYVNNEILHMKGFLRFKELESGVLFSEIGTKNNIIVNLADHFSDRLPNENWIIYDSCRKNAALHKAYTTWVLMENADIDMEVTKNISDTEKRMSALWKRFHKVIAIENRKNSDLQRNMLPLRFRDYMVEFCEK